MTTMTAVATTPRAIPTGVHMVDGTGKIFFAGDDLKADAQKYVKAARAAEISTEAETLRTSIRTKLAVARMCRKPSKKFTDLLEAQLGWSDNGLVSWSRKRENRGRLAVRSDSFVCTMYHVEQALEAKNGWDDEYHEPAEDSDDWRNYANTEVNAQRDGDIARSNNFDLHTMRSRFALPDPAEDYADIGPVDADWLLAIDEDFDGENDGGLQPYDRGSDGVWRSGGERQGFTRYGATGVNGRMRTRGHQTDADEAPDAVEGEFEAPSAYLRIGGTPETDTEDGALFKEQGGVSGDASCALPMESGIRLILRDMQNHGRYFHGDAHDYFRRLRQAREYEARVRRWGW